MSDNWEEVKKLEVTGRKMDRTGRKFDWRNNGFNKDMIAANSRVADEGESRVKREESSQDLESGEAAADMVFTSRRKSFLVPKLDWKD